MSGYRIPKVSHSSNIQKERIGMSTAKPAKRAKRINSTAILRSNELRDTVDQAVPTAKDWDNSFPTMSKEIPASRTSDPMTVPVKPWLSREHKKPKDLGPERPIPSTASSSKPSTLSVTKNPFVSCYLICQEESVKIMNKVGHVKYQIIEKSDYIKGEVTMGDT